MADIPPAVCWPDRVRFSRGMLNSSQEGASPRLSVYEQQEPSRFASREPGPDDPLDLLPSIRSVLTNTEASASKAGQFASKRRAPVWQSSLRCYQPTLLRLCAETKLFASSGGAHAPMFEVLQSQRRNLNAAFLTGRAGQYDQNVPAGIASYMRTQYRRARLACSGRRIQHEPKHSDGLPERLSNHEMSFT